MNKLPLWRRCRALAYPLRIEMLNLLAQRAPLCVKEIAESLLIEEETACKHLQLMAAAEFIIPEQAGKYLYYTLAEDALVAGILEQGLIAEQVICTVTALTHERRISILQVLGSEPLEPAALCRKTGISQRALKRQLEKLERRGFLRRVNRRCMLATPDSVLGRRMVKLALKPGTPAQVCHSPDG